MKKVAKHPCHGFLFNKIHIFYKVCFLLPSNKRTNATRSAWAARSWPTSTHETAAPTTFTNGCQWFLCAIRRLVLNGLSGFGPTTNWWSEFSPGETLRYVTCQIEFLHQGTSINSSCPSCFFVAIVHDSPRNCKSLKMWRKWTLHQKNRKFQSVKQRKKCCQLRHQILTQLFLVTKIDKNLPDLTIQHCRYPCDQLHGSGIHILCSKHVGSTTNSTFCLSDHSVWLGWWDLATGGWVVLRWLGIWSYGKPTVTNHPSIIRSSPLKCCTEKTLQKNCIQDQPWKQDLDKTKWNHHRFIDMCVCLVSCGDQNCCATSAKNPSGSNCNVTYWEGRNRVPKNCCEDQTQEVFIMDFRHSYVYHIYDSWSYKNIPKCYHEMLMCTGFWRFISLSTQRFESQVSTPAFAMCYLHWRAWSVDPNSSAWELVRGKHPTKTGRKLLLYNFCYYLAGN